MTSKPFFEGRGAAQGTEGNDVGTLQAMLPFPNFVIWGQRVEEYAHAVGFVAGERFFNIEAICWPSDAIDNATLNRLKEKQLPGNSLFTIPDSVVYGTNIGSTQLEIRFQTNEDGRISGFAIGPLMLATPSDALSIGEIVAIEFERSAALAGVPLRFATIRASSTDRALNLSAVSFPYPIVPLMLRAPSQYPIVEILLRTLADGRRANSMFYRSLVFFKIVELYIEKLQPRLIKTFYKAGLSLEKFGLRLPKDPFEQIDAALIGVSYTAYRSQIQPRLRDVIAHLDPHSPIHPFDLSAEQEVRKASIVLHYIASMTVAHVSNIMETLAKHDVHLAKTLTFNGVDNRR